MTHRRLSPAAHAARKRISHSGVSLAWSAKPPFACAQKSTKGPLDVTVVAYVGRNAPHSERLNGAPALQNRQISLESSIPPVASTRKDLRSKRSIKILGE
jgi:hypothetical protein